MRVRVLLRTFCSKPIENGFRRLRDHRSPDPELLRTQHLPLRALGSFTPFTQPQTKSSQRNKTEFYTVLDSSKANTGISPVPSEAGGGGDGGERRGSAAVSTAAAAELRRRRRAQRKSGARRGKGVLETAPIPATAMPSSGGRITMRGSSEEGEETQTLTLTLESWGNGERATPKKTKWAPRYPKEKREEKRR